MKGKAGGSKGIWQEGKTGVFWQGGQPQIYKNRTFTRSGSSGLLHSSPEAVWWAGGSPAPLAVRLLPCLPESPGVKQLFP